MDLAARKRLIDQLLARGQIDEAISEYLNLADIYYRLAELEMSRKTYKNALRLAQQSNVDRAWTVQILYNMADIDMQRLEWRQALRVYEQIRTLEPGDQKARTRLVNLNCRLGQETRASAELDNFVSYLESNAQPEQALEFLEELVKDNPDQVFIRSRLARQYAKLGRTNDAIAQWDAVGEMLMDAGDRDGAIQAIQAILALNPPNAADYRRLLEQLGR